MTPRARAAVDAAALSYGVPVHIILSPSRKRDHFIARWIAIRLMRQVGMSTVKIGRELGRDHSTIISALKHQDFNGERFQRAYGRAAVMFSDRLSLVLGKIVYEQPIGPPTCKQERVRREPPIAWRHKTPDQKWAELHQGKFENVKVRQFDGNYTAAMSEAAVSLAREL